MSIPTRHDHDMAEIEALHGVVMVRLRTWHRAGARRTDAGVKEALAAYADAVMARVQDQP